MKLIIDIPDYELEKVKNGSIASGIILKAVKNATPITDGDLISRSVAINLLNEAQVEFDEYYKGLGKAKTIIDNAPTVEQTIITEFKGCDNCELERPQGKWISDYRICKCSVCNFTTVIDTYNFCPNCGADMRKGGAEE